jgi:hypothetical protein
MTFFQHDGLEDNEDKYHLSALNCSQLHVERTASLHSAWDEHQARIRRWKMACALQFGGLMLFPRVSGALELSLPGDEAYYYKSLFPQEIDHPLSTPSLTLLVLISTNLT